MDWARAKIGLSLHHLLQGRIRGKFNYGWDMRAMVLERPGAPLRLLEAPRPTPAEAQVLLEVRACGVCRTDLHIVDGELSDPKSPLIPGHQIVGIVSAWGAGVTGLSLGDRVGAPWLGWTCGACPACTKTRALQHPDLKFLFPVSGEEKELDDTVAETIAALRGDPFFVFTYEKAASIRLSLTRELIRELAFQPFEAARRVVVVQDPSKNNQ